MNTLSEINCVSSTQIKDVLKDLMREELRCVIREVVKEELERSAVAHRCPLEDLQISAEEHKQHHRVLRQAGRDWSHLRTAFLLGVATAVTGGIITAIYLGIKLKLIEGLTKLP